MQNVVKQKKDHEQIKREFTQLQTRQIIGIAITMFAVMLCAVLYKRSGVLGEYSTSSLVAVQIVSIASFIVFTSYNWRCPTAENSWAPTSISAAAINARPGCAN